MQAKAWVGRGAGAVAMAALVACGGGGDDKTATAAPAQLSAGADGLKKALRVFTPTTPIPPDAGTRGMWSPVHNWPLVAVHAVLMPDGRVLSFGSDGSGRQTGNFIYDVWDPAGGLDGGHLTLPNTTATDIFCSSTVVLPDGSGVFVAGGDIWTGTSTTNTGNNNSNLFSYAANTLTRGNNLNRQRWYSTSTTLLNGETYIQGGLGGTDFPEVRGTGGTFRLLTGAATGALNFFYPRNFIAPNGRVFGFDSNGNMYSVDAAGTGSITPLGQFAFANASGDASAAMFRPGRILQFGGNSNGAIVIDVRGAAPVVTATQSMASQRRLATGTVLADGKVLATGGSSVWNQLVNVAYNAEIWNPDTGTWTVGASALQARLYHSNALLMPDATVLVAGGGAPGPQNNLNVELYYPPYLFTAAGTLAPRPVIDTAPTVLDIGATFTLQTSNRPVARVVLVKNGATTHGFNMEQRYIELASSVSGGQVSVQAPARAADAPPGFYMLFALDAAGVPSEAKMVRVNVAATPDPATVPTLTPPGNQAGTAGVATSLQLRATDPNGDTLRYGATGLPPGLVLNAATGLVSGTPGAAGAYSVTVTASDGVNVVSASFSWSVAGAAPLTVSVLPTAAVLSGSNASFTASAAGLNPRFKWNFGDGSAETAYAVSPTASHAYGPPGLYFVTVTAIDDRGVESRQTVQQAIYLPATAARPAASSSLMFESRSGANARLWVVNPDNDSVSVFDALTRARLAEIAVGEAPRTLARAANGTVWVTNKGAATISVIDPTSLAVARTIALARGSQPFGIVTSASGNTALVVLEATGQLLRFDTASYSQSGSVGVGANPRHVSIGGDGATVLVSRFITPPLAGEATLAVDTSSGGGEVVSVNRATMSVVRSFRLAHSDKPDAENQGRGVPNYLGAAAISPDGTQAWVPSKQDNVRRGTRRDGLPLNFQNSVRAISSRLDLAGNREDLAARIDHDNAGVASAATFDQLGSYLFVALETSREIAVIDAHGRRELFRFDAGRAPQGLAVSADNRQLFVSNFMDRSVGVHDLGPLLTQGVASVPLVATLGAIGTERLAAEVLRGKQFFYDARDPRLARDRYLSCASCHNDGGHDGRVWDMSNLGEGLRNTIALRGRAGGHGFKHWSNNFDEVQDFEGQIRTLAGGTGLMTDAAFGAGTRSQPLGDRKAGVSADLDALAAYVGSLATMAPSPYRPSATSLSAAGAQGRSVFTALNCAACHSGAAFTGSGENTLVDIGSVKPASGSRLGAALAGIDVPTLRDVWATAPYLHDGSAPTLGAAVRAHGGVSVSDADLASLTAYLLEIGGDEAVAPANAGTGLGLGAVYYNSITPSGSAAVVTVQAVDFDWGTGAPIAGVNADNFSVRWAGSVVPPATGTYRFQTVSDDGVRLWVNGVPMVDRWDDHGATTDTGPAINLVAGVPVEVRMEFYERGGGATARLRWLTPGNADFVAIPAANLRPPVVAPATVGLTANYFNNLGLTAPAALVRTESVDFGWGTGSPGPGVGVDNFSVRWSGTLVAAAAGSYRMQTESDDGVRLWIDNALVVDNWTDHAPTNNGSNAFTLAAGQRVAIRMEYYERGGGATARLRWLPPGAFSYAVVPIANLLPN